MDGKHLPEKPLLLAAKPIDDPIVVEFRTSTEEESRRVRSWIKYRSFLGLVVTTVLSSLLFAGNQRNWTRSGTLYRLVDAYPASTQIFIQILANILGLVHVSVISVVVNYVTRLRFNKIPTTMDVVRLWSDLCATRMDWDLPMRLFVPLSCFVVLMALPSGLWAGALSPIRTTALREGVIRVPGYTNSSLIREYGMEIPRSGPVLRNRKGLFSYSMAGHLQGSILSLAASASPVEGGVREHAKMDNTRFTFYGRSFGVGASVGLGDDTILNDNLTTGYSFEEAGYEAAVTCIFNSSTDFVLRPRPAQYLFSASGHHPQNMHEPENAVYYSNNISAIVAIGVGRVNEQDRDRIIAIAAGDNYAALNATQCSIEFMPTRFNVSVGLLGRNITITAISAADDIEPSGNLTFVTARQYMLISIDQTNLYNSLVGDSFNASISDYRTSRANSTNTLTEGEVTLAGLTNYITAMADDLLMGYASAQLMVGNVSFITPATVEVRALQFGQGIYIYAVICVNTFIILVITVEAIRTRLWHELLIFDYMDTRSLMLGHFRNEDGTADVSQETPTSLRDAGRVHCYARHHSSPPD